MDRTLQAHNVHVYFTLVSERDKRFSASVEKIYFPKIILHCSIHIQHNVLTKCHSKHVAAEVCKLDTTFSSFQENKMLKKIHQASEAAF
jgi:hypothetical protein